MNDARAGIDKYTRDLNIEQLEAFETLLEDGNVFLTGKAGTGKSFILHKYLEYCEDNDKSVLVTAPTGLAALSVKGATLHRTFNIPIGPVVEYVKTVPKKLSGALMKTDVLIIEEVSMCRFDQFSYVIDIIFKINSRRTRRGLKPIKVITIGDFFQLPPVIPSNELEALQDAYGIYGEGYAFKSEYWKKLKFKPIILLNVERQTNDLTRRALNCIRIGSSRAIEYFNVLSNKNFIDEAVYLCARNNEAYEFNQKKFKELIGRAKTYVSSTTGKIGEGDKSTLDEIDLKVGTRVIMIANTPQFSNGEFGKVVKLGISSVLVELDSGSVVKVEPYTWEVYNYALEKETIQKKVIGTFTQLPLKLGYAITIHKSQGQTYDKVNLSPYCWEKGQLYVALSRVRDVRNLHLTHPISERYLVASEEVLEFYTKLAKTNNKTSK